MVASDKLSFALHAFEDNINKSREYGFDSILPGSCRSSVKAAGASRMAAERRPTKTVPKLHASSLDQGTPTRPSRRMSLQCTSAGPIPAPKSSSSQSRSTGRSRKVRPAVHDDTTEARPTALNRSRPTTKRSSRMDGRPKKVVKPTKSVEMQPAAHSADDSAFYGYGFEDVDSKHIRQPARRRSSLDFQSNHSRSDDGFGLVSVPLPSSSSHSHSRRPVRRASLTGNSTHSTTSFSDDQSLTASSHHKSKKLQMVRRPVRSDNKTLGPRMGRRKSLSSQCSEATEDMTMSSGESFDPFHFRD